MKFIATLTTTLMLAGAATADNAQTGSLVWDAGLIGDTSLYGSEISQVEISVSPVMRDSEGALQISGDKEIKRHFVRNQTRGKANFQKLDLPAGEYVLSGINYRSSDRYQAFCPLAKTVLVEVTAGETAYLGQLQLNEPTGSPTKDAAFTPIAGLSRSMSTTLKDGRWKFGEALLAHIESVSLAADEKNCGRFAKPVNGW